MGCSQDTPNHQHKRKHNRIIYMNEIKLNNFDYKVLHNFHRVNKKLEADTSFDMTQFCYDKNSKRIVFGNLHYTKIDLICTYDTDFRFKEDLTIDLDPFLKFVERRKKLPKVYYKKETNRIIIKGGSSISEFTSRVRQNETPFEKLIPDFTKMKKDFSFRLNADFFKKLVRKKSKLRNMWSFDYASFISVKNELYFRLGKGGRFRQTSSFNHIHGGVKTITLTTDIKTNKRFALRLNPNHLKFLPKFFQSDYEVTCYHNRHFLVFRNIYKPITYIFYLQNIVRLFDKSKPIKFPLNPKTEEKIKNEIKYVDLVEYIEKSREKKKEVKFTSHILRWCNQDRSRKEPQ